MICNICNKEFESIKELTKHLVVEHSYSAEQIYSYYKYSFESGEATCPICGKEFIMTKRQISGFRKNKNKSIGCCTSCSKALIIVTHGSPLANPEIHEKTRETLFKNYGVTCPAKSKVIQERTKQTNLEKYGVENPIQVKEFKEKAKQTSLKKFGTEYAIASKEIRDKAKQTLLKSYGVENAFQSEEIKERIKEKNLEVYGVEHAMQSKEVQERMKKTNLEKRGVEFPMQSKESQENAMKTNLKKYGFKYTFQSPEIQEKIKETMIKNHGVEHPMQSEKIKNKAKKSNIKKYGTPYVLQSLEVRNKISKTNIERHGVEHFCQHEKCINANYSRISKVNKKFQEFLLENNVESELEFIINNSGFDLKIEDTLVEIDPWFTHNSTIGPVFGDKQMKPKSHDYQMLKTTIAKENGYRCVHVFDWDDWNKIVMLLKSKEQIYARNCEVREINKKEAKEFLDNYHIQESSRNVKHAYGLYYNNELVQVMTFGKPRYNKNYEYELLRLCTLPGYTIVGGASKLFKYFERNVKPASVISYCDLSKFSGEVYENLEFELIGTSNPARHWYNPKTKRHITDNLLRQRGFDQLHNTNFGKGTSNEDLMLEHGYVEIYDCGQATFAKKF